MCMSRYIMSLLTTKFLVSLLSDFSPGPYQSAQGKVALLNSFGSIFANGKTSKFKGNASSCKYAYHY